MLQCAPPFFFFNHTAPTEIYTLSLHDALPIYHARGAGGAPASGARRHPGGHRVTRRDVYERSEEHTSELQSQSNLVCRLLLEKKKCYNVLPQLDINNTIDHRPDGDEKWFVENEKTVTQFCRKLAAERPLKDIRDEYNCPKKKGIKDECSRLLEASTMKSRRGFAIQRLMNAMRQAHADGWFIVFDTLTLAD